MTDVRAAALISKAWPFEEARKLLKRWPDGKPDGAPILFETGYGPSGLPHIGTFQEVLRTTMVRRAFTTLSDHPTRLLAFSDDMDGLRKVPDNVPNGAMLAEHLGKPLTEIPDPFGTHDSFAAHNNARLRAFLDQFGFDYEFASSTQYYRDGRFDDALKGVLRHYDAIMAVMLPTLGAERKATYSPVLPISPTSGIVLQVPVEVIDADEGTVAFNEGGERVVQSVLSGRAKLQWKPDWGMRWAALGVDYEMHGKDLIDSAQLGGRICQILGGRKPETLVYELFLDERGEKISKSKGNGLSIDQWLANGPAESLAYYIYREPKRAKQLHLGVIPRAVDDYWKSVADYATQPVEQRLSNPVHHIHDGAVPESVPPVSFGLLLNLVGVLGAGATKEQVRGYLQRFLTADQSTDPALLALVPFAITYHRHAVAPTLRRRVPTERERELLELLDVALAAHEGGEPDAAAIQAAVYAIGNEAADIELRDWFQSLYEMLLGTSRGPRMGSFIALYGVKETRDLIAEIIG